MNDDGAQPTSRVPLAEEQLDFLSLDELAGRIAALRAEIARVEAAIEGKRAAQSSALAAFKAPPPDRP